MQTTEQVDMAHRLLADDEQVLEDILRAFGPVLLAVMSRRYHGALPAADIEDAVSIGLFRLWKSRRQFDSRKASLKVWLFRIVENAIRDVLRHGWHKARKLEVTGDSLFLCTESLDSQTEGEDEAPLQDSPTSLQLDVRDIVASLSDVQRRIIAADAATRDGTANSQLLAEELKIPASTVRVYRKRAMDRIRRELRERGHDVP